MADSYKFEDANFEWILKSAGVKALTKRAAEKALAYAVEHAPVKTGAYRAGLQIKTVEHAHRTTYLVVGTAPHTMLVEARTGNLRKALKAGKVS